MTERFRGSTHDGTNLNTVKEVISQNVAVAQLVFRASVWYTEGRWFESNQQHKIAEVVELVNTRDLKIWVH